MARPKVSNPKEIPVTVRLSRGETEHLDRMRGGYSRSAYLRYLLSAKIVRTARVDEPVPHAALPVEGSVTEPHPAVPDMPTVVEAEKQNHFHRYARIGEPVRYIRGQPQYLLRCACGVEREGT